MKFLEKHTTDLIGFFPSSGGRRPQLTEQFIS